MSTSTPRANLKGVLDNSSRLPVVEEQQLGSLIPHMFFFSPKGGLDPMLMTGTGITSYYGAETTQPLSDFGTHATVGLSRFAGTGATILTQRLRPADAPDPATITLSLEVVADEWDTPQRDADGNIIYGTDGQPVPISAGVETTTGFKARWLVGNLEGPTWALGAQNNAVGTLTGTGGTSTIYPIMEFPVSSFGSDGNYQGIRIWAPEEGGSEGLRTDITERVGAMLYRCQMIRKSKASGKVSIVPTVGKDLTVDFSVKSKFIDPETAMSYAPEDAIFANYDGTAESAPYEAQFNKPYIYEDNWNTVAEMIFDLEQNSDAAPDNVDMVNLISGVTPTGIPYYHFKLLGASQGGRSLTSTTNLWAAGGGDGTMSNAELDSAVLDILSNYSNQPYEFLDMARYPHTMYIDTGFNNDVKRVLAAPGGSRKDIITVVGTQVAGQPVLSTNEARSMIASLGTAIRQYPESQVYGTPNFRTFLIAGGGIKMDYGYGKTVLPASIEAAEKLLRFAAGRNWNNAMSIDAASNKVFSGWKDFSKIYLPETVEDSFWAGGAVYPAWMDEKTIYFKAFQTVYQDARSILNSPYAALAASAIERACAYAHRMMVGNASLTNEQFAAEIDRIINTECNLARLANKITVESTTTFTPSDIANGYSFTTNVQMRGQVMKTVGNFTIEALRPAE